jgi:hypothetical protein
MSGWGTQLDDIDRAIAREAVALRDRVAAIAETDQAWEDFEASRLSGVISLAARRDPRRRWVTAAAVGLVAAVAATVVVATSIRDDSPPPVITTPNPTTTPTPTTSVAPTPTTVSLALSPTTNPSPTTPVVPVVAARDTVVIYRRGKLIAVDSSGHERTIGAVPTAILRSDRIAKASPPRTAPFVFPDVSSSGWVAVTGYFSEGFWFFNLNEPSYQPRFVAISSPGGHTPSRGSWNPSGTLFAAAESDGEAESHAVVIDPSTGVTTRLQSTNPPIGYPPTWTADGTGILVGIAAPACVSGSDNVGRQEAIVPISGAPEGKVGAIPALADGLGGGVYRAGEWVHTDYCGKNADNPSLGASSVVLSRNYHCSPTGSGCSEASVDPQVDAGDVAPSVPEWGAFASTRPTLWVVGANRASRQVSLYELVTPHRPRLVNTIPSAYLPGGLAAIRAVKPDDSAIVVVTNNGRDTWAEYLVPTDGSRVTRLNGEYSGLVPHSLADQLSQTPQ